VLRDQKTAFGGRLIAAELQNPDFVKLAASFGIPSVRAEGEAGLAKALEEAKGRKGPSFIEVPGEPGSETSPWTYLHPTA
jgi:acetolactate synthase-1/2/3 large subunit